MSRKSRRDRIVAAFEAFHAAAEEALGAAERVRDRVSQRHAEAIVELMLRDAGFDPAAVDPELAPVFANRRVAAAVARARADRDAAFDDWLGVDEGPKRLAALMDTHATGVAGQPDGWLDEVGTSKLDGVTPAPQLWRIGTGTVGSRGVDEPGAFPVGVPLLDESHLQVISKPATRVAAESLIEALLLRTVGYFKPGRVHLHVWDVAHLTGSLPGLYPLTRTGVLTVHDPGDLEGLLDQLSDLIRKVHTRVLAGGHPSLKVLARETNERSEGWVVVVLAGNRQALDDEDEQRVQRVLRSGLACGISVVLLDVPMTVAAPMERVALERPDGTATSTMTGRYGTVTLDRQLPRDAVTKACNRVAEQHEILRTRVGTFHDLLPRDDAQWGTASSKARLHAPIGFVDGEPTEITLADTSPHALIGGPSGTGKTNLLLTMIASLAARYSPKELAFYLLDFKEGVSFAQFAPGRRDADWLPHARLIGVNINTDREFGLALLRFLADEMRRRAEAAKRHEVTKLEDLRREDPEGHWPRIVAVIDEFQYLFGENDEVTREATALLEDVARRGRSQGIHLVLASQDVSGIAAFWGKPSIFEQFVLRIGLPRARRVLAELNEATLDLPRWHAIVNHDSGISYGNTTVRIADASRRGTVDEVQRRVYEMFRAERSEPPVLFDGSRAPQVVDLVAAMAPAEVPTALVGQCIDVDGTPAVVPLPAAPGRNIAVLSAGGDDALRVLGAAVTSLAVAHDPGAAQFVLAPLVAGPATAAAESARRRLTGHDVAVVRLDGFRTFVEKQAAEVVKRLSSGERSPVYLVLWAADAADAVLERPGTEAMRQILRFGPETGVHVIGWWRSALRLKSLLLMTASVDDVGAFLGLDVQGTELSGLINPGARLLWSPRPGRALFFDRTRHARPEVVIVPGEGS
jgi:hypothetical protein